MNNYEYSDELYHHGVKGMKWGVRRYQNEDGTLTSAGVKRYGYNLDVNDTRRQNIAKIRRGEAQRRLDAAKMKTPGNHARIAELQGRVRSAKKAQKEAKAFDKGAALAAKGRTIGSNKIKGYVALTAASAGSRMLTSYLNSRLDHIGNEGRLTAGHMSVASAINKIGSYSIQGAAIAYNAKLYGDNKALRSYNTQRWSGDATIKKIGSTEYRDRKKQQTKK